MANTLARGMRAFFGFAKEVTNGTPVAAAHFLRVISMTPRNEMEVTTDPELSEYTDRAVDYHQSKVSLDVTVRGNYAGLELLMHSLLGTYTYVTPVAGEGSHSLSYNPDGTHNFVPGLTCYAYWGMPGATSTMRLQGCHATRVVIEIAPNGYVTLTFTLTGVLEDWTAAPTPTFPARLPMLGRHASLTGMGIAIRAAKWKSLRVTLEVPRDEQRFSVGGTQALEAVRIGKLVGSIEGNVELDQTSTAGLELYKLLSARSAVLQTISMTLSNGVTVATAGAYSMTIGGAMQLMGDAPAVQGPGIVEIPVRGHFVDVGASRPTVAFYNATTAAVV